MKIVLATVTSLVLATSAFAGSDEDYKAKFQQLDTDSSTTLSQEEVAAKGIDEQKFTQYDTNGDGSLSEDEFMAMKKDKSDHKDHGDSTYSQ